MNAAATYRHDEKLTHYGMFILHDCDARNDADAPPQCAIRRPTLVQFWAATGEIVDLVLDVLVADILPISPADNRRPAD